MGVFCAQIKILMRRRVIGNNDEGNKKQKLENDAEIKSMFMHRIRLSAF